jgi:hypothetical protein
MSGQNMQAPSCETVILTVGSTGMGRLKERGAEFSSVLSIKKTYRGCRP